MAFSWRCPFCDQNATITNQNHGCGEYHFTYNNKYDTQAIRIPVIVCPNPDCREFTLTVSLHDRGPGDDGVWKNSRAKRVWHLIPPSESKVFPDYIPDPITADYQEACLIRDLSPKSSATLSRRCLQGMIRNFWGVKKGRLFDEIEAIKDKVEPMTWAAIDAVRKIGNIGAHMEKDINLIIDIEPQEAKLLIGLIETLINDWYIVREERKKRMAQIVSVAEDKSNKKNQETSNA